MPTHWGIKRGKSVFQSIDQRSATGKEELLTVSSARGVVPRRTASVTMFKAESYLGYKLCWPGDLVINSLWAWGGGLGVSRHHGIISSAYGVYRIRSGAPLIPDYLHELVRSSPFHWELQVRSKGVWISRLQLTDDSFLDAPIPLPPPDEQAAMVRFLDYANGRLERAIRAKRKVIALLHEQKQAIIHRAVTRGLDPTVPLKPSGIPWLGDIPKHWEIRKLRHLTRHIIDGTHFTPNYRDDGVAFLRVTDIHEEVIDQSKLRRISKDEHFQLNKRCSPEKGDLLLSKNGTIGVTKVVDWDFPFSMFVSLCLIKPIKSLVNPHFISFAFAGGLLAQQLADTTKTTSVTNLHLDKIRTLILPVPPLEEQSDILVKTREEFAPLDTAIDRLEREIKLLREYRTRLVADVVTGKLDVRPAVRHLPAEIETPALEAAGEVEATDPTDLAEMEATTE
jgi:type I restriction enzyme, S subunit